MYPACMSSTFYICTASLAYSDVFHKWTHAIIISYYILSVNSINHLSYYGNNINNNKHCGH